MTVAGVDQYYETFFRPDLVMAALKGNPIDTGLRLADVKPAPRVSIIDTPSRAQRGSVSVTLKITDQGGGIGEIRLYRNGAAVTLDNDRALKPTDSGVIKTYAVALEPGENRIRAVVFNAENTMQSEGAEQTVSTDLIARKPSLHAVVVGVNQYRNPKLALTYAVKDAELLAQTLRIRAGTLFDCVEVTLLTRPEETTREAIEKTLHAHSTLRPDDLFVLYVASHGTVDDGEYFLLTSNVGATSTHRLREDALPQGRIKDLIAGIPTSKKLIVFDTCNAGKIGDELQTAMLAQSRGMSEDTAIKVLSRAVGSTILSASTSVQEALEGYEGHGLFTWALVEGLSGKADMDNDGYVKTTEIAHYVEDQVPQIAERLFKRAQFPTNKHVGPTSTSTGVNSVLNSGSTVELDDLARRALQHGFVEVESNGSRSIVCQLPGYVGTRFEAGVPMLPLDSFRWVLSTGSSLAHGYPVSSTAYRGTMCVGCGCALTSQARGPIAPRRNAYPGSSVPARTADAATGI